VETPYKKDTIGGITILSRYNLFKPKFVANYNYLKPGALYSQRNYIRTMNSYNQLGAWQQTAIDIFSNDSLGKLNMDVRLYPAVRRNLNIGLEASRNESDVVATNLFGLGVTFGITDKNIAKQSVQSTLNTRFGIELGQELLQTIQTSINYTLHFPKFILPFKDSSRLKGKISTEGTNLSINASNTLRKDFYTLQNANISWSYDWTKGREITRKNKIYLFNYSPINVEFQHVIPTDSLKGLIQDAPNLYYTFQDGFIISQNFRFQVITTKGKHTTSVKTGIEESGGLLGLIKNLDVDAKLFRFVKTFLDYSHNITYKKTALAFHAFGGFGFSYGQTKDTLGNIVPEQALPVTRGFTAGGPNSMRAWRARQLGPGSSKFYQNLPTPDLDRFGDIQLEGNAEYRYSLFNIGSLKVKSALFVDMGNIWLRNNQGQEGLNDGVFKLNRLYKDLAVGAGTSLRFDFDYFLIRLDWAYTIKNPIYADYHYGWFQQLRFFDGQFQLGINYPF
jgi:outer membrane translocation and assembly module TamA